jgi:hypothetical protein
MHMRIYIYNIMSAGCTADINQCTAIVMRLMTGKLGFDSRHRQKFVSCPENPERLWD